MAAGASDDQLAAATAESIGHFTKRFEPRFVQVTGTTEKAVAVAAQKAAAERAGTAVGNEVAAAVAASERLRAATVGSS